MDRSRERDFCYTSTACNNKKPPAGMQCNKHLYLVFPWFPCVCLRHCDQQIAFHSVVIAQPRQDSPTRQSTTWQITRQWPQQISLHNHTLRSPSSNKWNFRTQFLENFRTFLSVSRGSRHRKSSFLCAHKCYSLKQISIAVQTMSLRQCYT